MIGNLILLSITFLVGYSFGYEDLLLDGKKRPKDRLDELEAAANAKREEYLNDTPESVITD